MKPVKNIYKVNQKLWNNFKTNEAKQIFNDVMEQSLKNQSITTHPKMQKLPQVQWHTICWNFACYAAWAVKNNKLEKGSIVIDLNARGKEVSRKIAK